MQVQTVPDLQMVFCPGESRLTPRQLFKNLQEIGMAVVISRQIDNWSIAGRVELGPEASERLCLASARQAGTLEQIEAAAEEIASLPPRAGRGSTPR